MSNLRFLFILKHRESAPNTPYSYSGTLSSGLFNSVSFIITMLTKMGIDCQAVEAIDNNCIDRLVHEYKPSHVVIEALWVTPSKFHVLQMLHPHVKWIVRLHSNTSFLSQEGVAIDWIKRYLAYDNVYVAPNSPHALRDVRAIARASFAHWGEYKEEQKVIYLPNSYPMLPLQKLNSLLKYRKTLHVGCFGAIRPLKNTLVQAVAAIAYCDHKDYKLEFHVNGNRNEQGGDNALKNLRALFDGTEHRLVEHEWMQHAEFLKVVGAMDINLCVSFTETFCIVAADSVSKGVPTVVSKEIEWASNFSKTETVTNSSDIVTVMNRALNPMFRDAITWHNRIGLKASVADAQAAWAYFLRLEESKTHTAHHHQSL